MTPGYGPECDLCVPDVHYLLFCSNGHEWDEPPHVGVFSCPECGEETTVSYEEHQKWLKVIGVL